MVAATHPRYADPNECQYFYVCINGEVPRRSGCKLGQVFDDSTKTCDWARKVPEWWVSFLLIFRFEDSEVTSYLSHSADWYKDQLTDEQLHELEFPTPKPTKSRPSVPSRRKPGKRTRVQQKEEEEAKEE